MSDAIVVVRRHGKNYVAKRVAADSHHDSERANAELRTLRHIPRGQNLNYMIEHFWSPTRSHLTMILEYCDGGTLYDVVDSYRARGKELSENFLIHAMHGVTNALVFLHDGIVDVRSSSRPARGWTSICHLDMKPNNVFLSLSGVRGQFKRIVLGDFGASVSQHGMVRGSMPVLTPGWLPPEADSGTASRYGPATDIYQLGALIQTLGRLIDEPDQSRLFSSAPLGSSYSRDLNDFVGELAARDWRGRPDARRVSSGISLS